MTISIDPQWLASWVARSCENQDVPVKVSDPGVMHRVGVLLGAVPDGPRAHGAPAPSTRATGRTSQPPHDLHPAGVQGAGSGNARGDDGVVDHSANNRGLPFQVQPRPPGP